MKIAIVDYGMGNIRSLQNALKKIAVDSYLSNDRKKVLGADHVILPGVGSAEPAMKRLWQSGLTDALMERSIRGAPTTGICLGMQLMASHSTEGEGDAVNCLDLIPATVDLITKDIQQPGNAKLPSIGWYRTYFPSVAVGKGNEWLNRFQGARFYYIHSYKMRVFDEKDLYGNYLFAQSEIASVVGAGPNMAVQFHPEKSGEIGLTFLHHLINRNL